MQEDRTPASPGTRLWRRLADAMPRTRTIIAATSLAIICGAPFAVAATGDPLRQGVRNGTIQRETEIIANTPASAAAKGGYATRQSNLSASGGGAIYGCRSKQGGTGANPPQEPCLRSNNLSTGLAFEFNAQNGPVVGTITAGGGGDSRRPFVTNATGVATGLNADRHDSLQASEIIAAARAKAGLDADTLDGIGSTGFVQKSELLWALVDLDSTGASVERTNGATGATRTGAGNFTVTFNRDISGCVIQATAADANGAGPPGPGSTPAYWVTVDNQGTDSVQLFTLDEAGANVDPGATDGATVSVMC